MGKHRRVPPRAAASAHTTDAYEQTLMTRIKKQTHPGVEPTESVRARVGGGLDADDDARVSARARGLFASRVVRRRYSVDPSATAGRTDGRVIVDEEPHASHRLHASRSSLRTHPVVVLSAVPTAHRRRSFQVVGLSVVDEGKTAARAVRCVARALRSSFVRREARVVGIDRAKFGSVVPGLRRASSCAGRRAAPRRRTDDALTSTSTTDTSDARDRIG